MSPRTRSHLAVASLAVLVLAASGCCSWSAKHCRAGLSVPEGFGIPAPIRIEIAKAGGGAVCKLTVTPSPQILGYYSDPWNHPAEYLQAFWYLSAPAGGFGVQSTDEVRIRPKTGSDPNYFRPSIQFSAAEGGIDSGNALVEPPAAGYTWSYRVEFWRGGSMLCAIDPDLIIRKGPGTIIEGRPHKNGNS